MAMEINKIVPDEIIHAEDSILTPLYGQIKIADEIDLNKYTYFDTVDGYDLFVSETGDETFAVKAESLTEDVDNVETDTEKIKNNYNVDIVKYDDTIPAIIIKVKETDTEVLNTIEKDFENNTKYSVKRITPQVLFLEINDVDIQLEDNAAIDKLSDQDMKNVIQKTGIKLNGTENKERLKGIMQGVLASTGK